MYSKTESSIYKFLIKYFSDEYFFPNIKRQRKTSEQKHLLKLKKIEEN